MTRLMQIAAIFLGLSLLGGGVGAEAKEDKVYKKLETLSKILSYVESNYIEETKTDKLLDDALRGMLVSLDPHTLYMPPEIYKEMQVGTKGEFGGLGIEISIRDAHLMVVSPIEDTPASRAGIQSGDRILTIDGVSTTGMTLLDAVKQLRGPMGSKVKLMISRDKVKEAFEVVLTRQRIRIQSVASEIFEDKYAYLRVKSFQEHTARELSKHLDRFQKKLKGSYKGLILDLRNNPGGLLDQAILVADEFLDSGVIVSTIGRKGSFQEVKMAHKEGARREVPMITLVNEGTASASEVVAGALQDHGRSIILGKRTFGKGSVQTIIDLGDGSGLKLTIAHYYTPKGRSIQALGIDPDIIVSENATSEPVDEQLHFREEDLKGHFETPDLTSKGIKSKETAKESADRLRMEGDPQLSRALEYLKTWEVFRGTSPVKAQRVKKVLQSAI